MTLIVCHPDNLEAVKTAIQGGKFDKPTAWSLDFRIQANTLMDRDKATGRYKLPNGKAVLKEQIVVRERFFTYGPEDLDWLLYAGIIHEEREMLVYVIDDLAFRVSYDQMPRLQNRIVTVTDFS